VRLRFKGSVIELPVIQVVSCVEVSKEKSKPKEREKNV